VRFGLLSYPGVANLGDAIQSLAARRFLPRVDLHVPRELLSQQPEGDGPVRLIANGWFMQNPRFWPPHEAIEVLPISMHFAETDFGRFQRWRPRPLDRLLAGAGADYLRAVGPIGARDDFTADQLNKRGIPAYLSGCLTLTLELPSGTPRDDFLIACDLTEVHLAHLKRQTDRRVISISHTGKPYRDAFAQEAEATEVLGLYARAAAVVTTRVHAALPCLAFGTPVLLIEQSGQGRRVSDVAELVHSCLGHEFLRHGHDFDLAAPPPNPETFRPLAALLEAKCRTFVSRP
jgi:hypothetical protein